MWQSLKTKVVKLLRWSERYTKTDMVYVTKGGGWLSFDKAIKTLTGLALATAFANLIPQDTYGTYKFVISAAGIISAFTLSGVGTAITRSVARGFDGAFKEGARARLKWSIGIVVVGIGTALYYHLQGNATLAMGMGMIAAFYPIIGYGGLYQNFLDGKKDFKRKSLYQIGTEVFEVGTMVAVLFLTNNVLWVLLAFFATNTISAMVFYFRSLAIYQPSEKTEEGMISYSKHLSAVNLFHSIARHIDKVLVWHYLGAVELAIYAFAELPISKIQTMLGSIRQIALPKFSEKKLSTLRDTLDYKVLLMAFGFLGIAVVYILAAPFLFDLLFPEYMQSIPYTQVYALGLVLYAGRIYEQTLEAHMKTKWIYISRFAGNIIKIITLLILLPIYGIWGAIVSLLVWEFVRVLFSYIGFRIAK